MMARASQAANTTWGNFTSFICSFYQSVGWSFVQNVSTKNLDCSNWNLICGNIFVSYQNIFNKHWNIIYGNQKFMTLWALLSNSCRGLWGVLQAHIGGTTMQCSQVDLVCNVSKLVWFSILLSRTRPFPKNGNMYLFQHKGLEQQTVGQYFKWTFQNAVMPEGRPN